MIAHIRWQALLVLISIALLVLMALYLAMNYTTVVVPDRGGTYLEGLVGIPQYINPILCQDNQVDRDLVALVFNGLTRVGEKGEIVDDLAESHEVSEGGLVYTFRLRPDVRWHDGRRLTADDVAFTISAMRAADYQGDPHLAEFWRGIKVDKLDDLTVKFTLPEPFTPFVDYATVGILPAHVLGGVPGAELPRHPFNLRPIGTGPFAVKQVTAEMAQLEATARTWAPNPYLARIQFKFYPSYDAMFTASEHGQIEGIPGIRPQDTKWVQKQDSLQLYTARSAGYTLIYVNHQNPNTPFFADAKVRQALMYGLDRQELVNTTLNGQGIVADGVIMPDSWAYDPSTPRIAFDESRARQLLDEAGWVDADGDGVREQNGVRLEFALLGSDDAQRIRMMEEISRQWERIGVRAHPQTAGITGLVGDFLRPRRYDALLTEWQELTPDPDPYPLWHSTQVGEGGQNYSGYANSDLDQCMEEARRVFDPTRRIELYRDFQRIFAEERPGLVIHYPVYNYAVSRLVHGIQLGPIFQASDRFQTIDRWYIATRRVIMRAAESEARN